jgi:cytochrome c oxidase assembly protein subunit 15
MSVVASFRVLATPARIAAFAAVFAFGVIVFGAFVRLSDAGLSCPDWPTCYGQAAWPGHEKAIAEANAAFPDRPYETHKAWREQVHRMLAGTLGVLVLVLAVAAAWRRRGLLTMLGVAALAAAVGIALYIRQSYALSGALSLVAIALPLIAAFRLDRPAPWRVAIAVLGVVVFQAMLGMWTVTLLLKPIVVMGHLLGGLLTFSLLSYVALALTTTHVPTTEQRDLERAVIVGLVLLACQIALGGWTSANYAALACGFDFPQCQGSWWPSPDFREGFVLWRGIGVNYEGGVLDAPARAAIQIAHRIGALVVFCYLGWLAHGLARAKLRGIAIAIGVLLIAQVTLGIGNVKLGLPLPVATAHNGVAALLLLSLIAALVRVTDSNRALTRTPFSRSREKVPAGG